MAEEKVKIISDGLKLEGILEVTAGASANNPAPGVVLCHPHSLYGGRMDNNVIHAVSLGLGKRGIAALRFNFRGVDGSEGSFDDGKGETSDALAAVSYLVSRDEVDSSRVGIMGYSFGGAVALAAGIFNEEVQTVAAVSPVGLPSFGEDDTPRLIICGSQDEIVSSEAILEEKDAIGGPSGSGSVEIIPGADHFWFGYEAKLADLLADFFAEHL